MEYIFIDCGDDVFQASFLEEVESLSGVNMRDFYQVNSVIDSSDIQRKGKFQIVSTSLKDKNGNPLFFWGRYSNGSYVDLEVGLKEDFDKCRTIFTHPYIGKLLFEDNHELEKFLDKLVHMALPEPWEFHNDKVKYSILRSYLQFTFFKLEKEDEIVQDNDKKKIQEGKSENVMGKILKQYNRSDIIIADKSPLVFMHTKDDVKRIFEQQLKEKVGVFCRKNKNVKCKIIY